MKRETIPVREVPILPPAVVQRQKILQLVESFRPRVVVFIAPGGYGKSVAAAQIARQYSRAAWFDLDGGNPSRERLYRLIAGLIDTWKACQAEASLAHEVMKHTDRDTDTDLPDPTSDCTCCVVLDDLGSRVRMADLEELANEMREQVPGSLLIATAREIVDWGTSGNPGQVLVVHRDDLLFSRAEATQLSRLVPGCEQDPEASERCYDLSGGHPALLALLLRHPAASGAHRWPLKQSVSDSLSRHLETMIDSHLSPTETQVLECCAVLGSGCLDDVVACAPETHDPAGLLHAVASSVPLVRLDGGSQLRFSAHQLVLDALTASPRKRRILKRSTHVDNALRLLESRGRFHRVLEVVRKIGSTEEVAGILARVGEEMLTGGSHEDVRWWLQQIPPSVKMELPSLTLLEAHLLRDSMKFSDASRTLEATERLAEHSCDIAMQLEAAISRAILAWAFGHLAKGSEALRQVLLAFPESQRTAHIRARAWLLLLSGNELPAAVMRERCDQLESALAETGDQGAAVCATYNTLGVIRALILGDIIPARKLFRLEAEWEASRSSGLGVGRANEALLLLTAGRLESARRILRPVLEDPRSVSSELHFAHFMSTVACIFAGLGDYDKSLTYCERSFRYSSRDCPAFHRILAHLELSEILRSAGRAETAHDEAETALLMLEGGEWRHFKFQAATERLASRLALGDEALVYEEGLELRKTLEGTGYSFYLLRLDMVLAEIERRRGELDKAASRIAEHAEHIRGEGSNWHMAMYTRAFPGLLSVFARALGPDGIPIHMLRMLLEPTATRALEMAQGTLDEHAFRRLVLRTLGKAKGAEFLSAHEGPPVLRVRLFGGLSVEGPQGPVPDKAWGKRKARLLFAMLAIELGRDVPRDIIFDRLWPDMPADRAQSNFYVTWSYMKKALAACAGDPAPYLEHRGGVCRVVPEFVTTDLAEFFHAAEALRKAKAGGEPESVIDAAERMAGLYAGELLAGDLYEDWCSETRERVRHEFSDAMLAGAEALADRGEPSRAVRLVRAALAHDPWREDLYQAALRYQIMAGQRSGAIETYMACRDRLAEDLGLDPSVETQRLYEQVLAMEEGAEAVPA